MQNRTKILIAGAGVALALAGGTTVAVAGGGDDAEAPITGSALERASAVALDYTGEGRVTDTEVGDEESLYEVEVTLGDGRQVDVQLDADFKVVGSKTDKESPGDKD
ncbi:MAG: hypothetical protein ABIS21_07055 [Acidimicrobiales bacterium]